MTQVAKRITALSCPFDPARLLTAAFELSAVDHHGLHLLVARQRARLTKAISWARAASPYYRERYRSLGPVVTDVRELPVVTKPELMAHFDAWVTDASVTRRDLHAFLADPGCVGDLFQGRYVVWATSGTTGNPGIFLHDRGALATYAALVVRRSGGLYAWLRNLPRVLRRGVRFASVVATGGHFASAAGTMLAEKSFSWGPQQYRTFSILDPLPKLVRDLNAFQPTDLMGYPSILAVLSREQRAGRLAIHPQSVTSSSEGLDPSVRQLITAAFGCPVQDFYGASEFPVIAFECVAGRLHVNADWVIVEAVDAQYRPVPPGQPSRTTLVTNLANRVAPLLRYDLGDSITILPGRCSCGSPLPAIRVEGRRDEVLFLKDGADAEIAVLPLALATVIEETPGVETFQAIQTGPGEIRIRLAVRPGQDALDVWPTVAQRTQAYLAAQGLPQVRLVHDPTPPGRDLRTGKLRHVWAEANLTHSQRIDGYQRYE